MPHLLQRRSHVCFRQVSRPAILKVGSNRWASTLVADQPQGFVEFPPGIQSILHALPAVIERLFGHDQTCLAGLFDQDLQVLDHVLGSKPVDVMERHYNGYRIREIAYRRQPAMEIQQPIEKMRPPAKAGRMNEAVVCAEIRKDQPKSSIPIGLSRTIGVRKIWRTQPHWSLPCNAPNIVYTVGQTFPEFEQRHPDVSDVSLWGCCMKSKNVPCRMFLLHDLLTQRSTPTVPRPSLDEENRMDSPLDRIVLKLLQNGLSRVAFLDCTRAVIECEQEAYWSLDPLFWIRHG